jgi:alkylresorcinol/alkylpyrone synthase
MPRIAAVTTAVPEHILEQAEVRAFAASVFPHELYERLLPVFDNANIDRRYFAVDADWLQQEHSFTEVNDRYIEVALQLSERVVCEVAEMAGITTMDFDALFFVSTTGLSTPSIDARLFNRIPLSPHIKRIPIWGLGCAGGASALARAAEYLRAFPTHRALVLTVELCSLAFQRADATKSNMIASALFGDGAAACLLEGDEVRETNHSWSQPAVLDSLSTIYPDSLDVMGWRITSDGFKVVLSRDIPSIVTNLVKPNIEELVKRVGLRVEQIKHYVAHPGGTKVLGAYEKALGVVSDTFATSRAVLREFGNMSSATVYFILKCFMERLKGGTGEYGLLSALGPGFSSELVLLQW